MIAQAARPATPQPHTAFRLKKGKIMKKLLFIFTFALSLSNLFAGLPSISITNISQSDFIAGNAASSDITISGTNFFPQAYYQHPRNGSLDVQHNVQVVYRQIYPTFGGYQVATFGSTPQRSRGVWISRIGPQKMRISIGELVLPQYANTVWSFAVCSLGVGCSNGVNVAIRGTGTPAITIDPADIPVDLAVGTANSLVSLRVTGLSTSTPVLKIGALSIWGNNDGHNSRFTVPNTFTAAVKSVNAFVEDPMTGTDSDNFSIRVFTVPTIQSPAELTIAQTVVPGKPIQDAIIPVVFAQMSFPSKVFWVDGAQRVELNVPMDLLTNRAKIKIPASALKKDNYIGLIEMTNIAGTKSANVKVNISGLIAHPLPNPFPIPHPHFPFPGQNPQ